MRVLVGYASKHGATARIAKRIGSTLIAAGYDVDVRPVSDTAEVSVYDAFVVGSASYLGHWLLRHVAWRAACGIHCLPATPAWAPR